MLCDGPLEAEARACLEGLELALQYSQLSIIIQIVPSWWWRIQEPSLNRSPLMHIVSKIKSFSSQNRACKFVKVDHLQIRVSHCLTNFTRAEHRIELWLVSGPHIMLQELELERSLTLSE